MKYKVKQRKNMNGSMNSQFQQVMMIRKMNFNQKIMKVVKAVTNWGTQKVKLLINLPCKILVRTPEKISMNSCPEFSIFDRKTPNDECHGLKDHAAKDKSINAQFPPPNRAYSASEFNSFVDVMGKMADTLNNHMEMLRDKKILNCMLRNTIDILRDDNGYKDTRIKELEKIIDFMGKPSPTTDTQMKELELKVNSQMKPSITNHCHDDVVITQPKDISSKKDVPRVISHELEQQLKAVQIEKHREYLSLVFIKS